MVYKKKSISEKDLVQALKSQKAIGLEALYSMYSNTILGIVSKILMHEDAQDVVQEILIKIWNSPNKYDSKKGRLFTWILNISRNYAIDVLRSRSFRNTKKNINLYLVQNSIELKSPVNINVDSFDLRNIIYSLKPEFRAPLILIYFNGCTHEEAAKELKLPLGTLKTRVRMAIMELRRIFNFVYDSKNLGN